MKMNGQSNIDGGVRINGNVIIDIFAVLSLIDIAY